MLGCFTADLHAFENWLERCGIKTAAMEATGVYWIALYKVLESRGVKVCVVNARQAKNLPGSKTDVKDCQWLQQFHAYGVISLVVPAAGRDHHPASLFPTSRMLVQEAATCIQHSEGTHGDESTVGQRDQRYQRYNRSKNPAADLYFCVPTLADGETVDEDGHSGFGGRLKKDNRDNCAVAMVNEVL